MLVFAVIAAILTNKLQIKKNGIAAAVAANSTATTDTASIVESLMLVMTAVNTDMQMYKLTAVIFCCC